MVEENPDRWAPFQFLLGSWRGRETGKAGEGRGERTYRLVLDDRYLFSENRSVFEPQEANPEGEVHEDRGYLSYDAAREAFVLRSFHSEGFVNQYVLEERDPAGETFVFVAEEMENVPEGWRARLTLRRRGENAFQETFELAAPDSDYEVFLENEWVRA